MDSLRSALILTGRAWKGDREFLKQKGLPFGQRLKWGSLSPVYHFAEFYGFWRGGLAAVARGRHPPAAAPWFLKIRM